MRSGELRDRVRIERLGSASSGYVSGSETWSTLFSCWADIKPMRQRGDGEQVIGDRLAGVSAFEIVIRYADEISDLSPRDRLIEIDTGRTFNIRHVMDPDGRKHTLKLTADTGKPEG